MKAQKLKQHLEARAAEVFSDYLPASLIPRYATQLQAGRARSLEQPRGVYEVKTFFLGIMLAASNVATAADDISGYWQHPEDPVWIEVVLDTGFGLAVRNDNDDTSVGFAVLKDIASSNQAGLWVGQVFVPQLDTYKSVELTLPDAHTLKMKVNIGFLRRSLEWRRVAKVPIKSADDT